MPSHVACRAPRPAGRSTVLPRWRHATALALAAAAVLAVPQAHAQLFADNEARKAILDLRSRVATDNEQFNARIDDMSRQHAELLEQIQQLRRSLVDLNTELEQVRADLARQRGENEQLARTVAELQQRQKDIAQGVDERMRRVEPQKVTLDGREFTADADEKRMYEEAFALLRSSDFAGASTAFTAFLKRWPGSGYAPSARFWLGNAYYGKRDYKEAIAVFRAFVTGTPAHLRAPEALLAVANCQIEMKDNKAARATLNELLKAYPASEAAHAGKERLESLK